MVQFCKQILYQNTETSIRYFWLRLARMEMDCNLKKLANFFKFLPRVVEKMQKNVLWFVLP